MGKVIDITERLKNPEEEIKRMIQQLNEVLADTSMDAEINRAKQLIQEIEVELEKEKKHDFVIGLVVVGIIVVACTGIAAMLKS